MVDNGEEGDKCIFMVVRHGERADFVNPPEPYPNNDDPPLTKERGQA
jgi:hypothetical protein